MAGGPSHRRQRPTVAGFDLVATTPTLVMAASTSSPLTSRADPGHNDSAAVHALSSCRVADICRAARLVCLEEASARQIAAKQVVMHRHRRTPPGRSSLSVSFVAHAVAWRLPWRRRRRASGWACRARET